MCQRKKQSKPNKSSGDNHFLKEGVFIKVLRENDMLSNLSTQDALLEVNSKKVRVIWLNFEDREINQRGTNLRFELLGKEKLSKLEESVLTSFVNANIRW